MIDVVSLAMQLMAVPSLSGDEAQVITLAERLLTEEFGWNVRRIPVSPGGRDCLLAYGDRPPELVFGTHLDVVPPWSPPRLDETHLHGRGACDAKGIAAAMICAATRLRDRGVPAGVLLVVGEETTHDGARAANAYPNACKVLINGEPTESVLAVGTKGVIRGTLTVTGRAAHSAYPHLGESATMKLVTLLAELDALVLPVHPVLGPTTINVGSLSGGVADNVIAPSAQARLMVRLVTPAEETMAVLRRWVGDRGTITFDTMVPPVLLGTVDGFETAVMAYATDVPELSNWGTPYLFGPGSITVAHTDEERIALDELRAAVEAYERLGTAALAREAAATR